MVFVVIPVVPLVSLISNNHFRYLLDLPRRFIRRRSIVPAHTHTDDTQHSQFLFQFLFSIFLSAM